MPRLCPTGLAENFTTRIFSIQLSTLNAILSAHESSTISFVEYGEYRWHYVLAANLSAPYQLLPAHVGLSSPSLVRPDQSCCMFVAEHDRCDHSGPWRSRRLTPATRSQYLPLPMFIVSLSCTISHAFVTCPCVLLDRQPLACIHSTTTSPFRSSSLAGVFSAMFRRLCLSRTRDSLVSLVMSIFHAYVILLLLFNPAKRSPPRPQGLPQLWPAPSTRPFMW
jgi:hypothetical protein